MLTQTPDTAPYASMSPTLLSQQPLSIPARKPTHEQSDWDAVFTHLEARLGMLRSWRWSWWVYWAQLARLFMPFRYVWLVVSNRMGSRGSPLNDAIIDSTGLQAVRTCAGGMWTGLTSPSRPWFKMGVALPWVKIDADGKAWLEELEQRVYTVLHQSNFYNIMAQGFKDETVFGTAPPLIYEDEEDVIRLYLPCAGEYYLQCGARLDDNTFYREFTLTVGQIVEQFQLENCPMQIALLWQEGGASIDTEFVVAHAIEPNFPISQKGRRGKDGIKVVPSKFVYKEVYWLKGTKTERPLSVRGFYEQPFFILKWAHVSNDAYGRSPCMDALGDNKQVQTETVRKAELIEKFVRPPMGAPVELKNEPASIMPGHITYFDTSNGKKGFEPLFQPNPTALAGITADIDKVSARLEKCLYVDLFMAISRMEGVQPRNELELTKRDLERLQELGPVIDLNERELSIAIKRVMAIMERRKMIPPKPKSLANVPLKINYVSIMRLAQRSAESIAMKDGFATAGALSSAAKAAGVPDPIRVIDLDKAMRHYLDLNNFPQDAVFTDEEVKQHDQVRAKAQQDAEMPGHAMAAVSAAKTLADTQIPGGTNALGAILGPTAGGVQ